jgi:RNA polymerase-binding transcription factor DksA
MPKRIRAIPLAELCLECRKGRMLAYATERTPQAGEFDSVTYRRCERCGFKSKARERMIGIWATR